MLKDKKENSQLLLELIGLSISILMVVGASTFYYFSDGYFREWLIMMIGLLGVLISGVITMMGVVLTLNRNINSEQKAEKLELQKKQNKIENLKMILKYEIEMFVQYSEEIVLSFINSIIAQWEDEKKEFLEIRDSDYYFISEKFNDFIYELLMLSDEKDKVYIRELLNFSYIYKNIKKTIDNDKNNNFIIVNTLCKEILKEEIYELL